MNIILAVAVGGAIGSVARYLVAGWVTGLFGAPGGFPWGTLAVNVIGGLIMGALIGWMSHRSGTPQELRAFLTVGIMGGFTTFSAFSLDAVVLWERGEAVQAGAYVAASVIISIAALVAGLQAARALA